MELCKESILCQVSFGYADDVKQASYIRLITGAKRWMKAELERLRGSTVDDVLPEDVCSDLQVFAKRPCCLDTQILAPSEWAG